MRVVIIEDEKSTREMLISMIDQAFTDINIVGYAESVTDGVELINNEHPDVILLDITLKEGTGFDLLEKVGSQNYLVIFITAHNEYAVKAFKISAVDYILKPVNFVELADAIEKCKKQLESEEISLKLNTLLSNLKTESNQDKKIVLKSSDTIHIVQVNDIVRCESDKSYTTFFLSNGKKILVSKTLKDFEDLLTEYGFFRSHQSHLVNTKYIDSYEKPMGGLLVMQDKSRVPVATRKKDALLELFNHL